MTSCTVHVPCPRNLMTTMTSRLRMRWAIAALVLCAALPLRADDAARQTFPIFHVGGFGDVVWHTSSENDREGLDLVELDVYSTLQLSNAWSVFGEAVAQRAWKRAEKVTIDADL